MSEILEKMLLTTFGLITFFMIIPMFLPLLNSIQYNSDSEVKNIELVENDIKIFKKEINQILKENFKKNRSNYFLFEGEINILYQNKLDKSYLHFHFYFTTEKSPIYVKYLINSSISDCLNINGFEG